MADWHWTENGEWSDPVNKSGYFTGSPELKEPLLSLTSKFTGESDASHLQWVVTDLRSEKPLNAVRIAWSNPYATNYRFRRWPGWSMESISIRRAVAC
jgi:hypothetical protein